MMVKQYVGEVQGMWCRFRVFQSGDPKWYVFDPLDAFGCSTTMQFPVCKRDLKDVVRRALAHGCSYEGGA